MAHSLANVILHIVFSTKQRERSIGDAVRARLHAYMAELGRDMGCQVFRVGGTADHVHLAVGLSRTCSIADFVKKIKQTSSSWMKDQGRELYDFSWQAGYGVFSISISHLEKLIAYIENQEEHHKTLSFQDEYRSLLRKNGIIVDETYLWD
jgi:REP element-mobilizing transposase RayT